MSDAESSPLLGPASKGKASADPARSADPGESTPLLSSAADTPRYDGENDDPVDDDRPVSSRSRRSLASSSASSATKSKGVRWASGIAVGILSAAIVAIVILAFILPDTLQEYAQEAAVLEPTNLSIDSITPDGVRARVQAKLRLDGSRVANHNVRRMGRAATWVAYQVATDETKIVVSLPDYHDVVLGSAVIPSQTINLRDGDVTHFDFVADVSPGDLDGIRLVANDWLDGRLEKLRLHGKADVNLKSGLLSLGSHSIAESLVFQAKNLPTVPQYNISRFNVKDGPFEGTMLADVALSAFNSYPVELDVPELGFDILLPGCDENDLILVAEAVTSEIHIEPQTQVEADVNGVIRELPESLTRQCPDSDSSPLDLLLKSFMHGEPATMFVRGSSHPDGSTPKWIAELLSSVTVPVPFPGRSLDGLIRSFSMTDTSFTMPDPFADPGDPNGSPKVSGTIVVTAGVPSEMNFGIDVTNVRASADVYYKKRKLGELNVRKWQSANSTRVEGKDGGEPTLKITSRMKQIPLNITDSDVFSEVIQALIFGGKQVKLDIKAAVDAKVVTKLGKLVVKQVPAQGKFPVKPLPKGSMGSIAPKVGSLRVVDTSSDSITLEAAVKATNPTPYSATVPYANIHILHNDTLLGDATVRDLSITPGPNQDVVVRAKWNPHRSGDQGRKVGRDLISQYLSGYNTTLTIKAHRESIPGQPILCDGLSKFNFTFDTPKIGLPDGSPDQPSEGQSHFIRDATFHILSSTATFTLASPLEHNTIYLDFVNATAFYNHTEPVGRIEYNLPFAAPPGLSETPRLPVDWSLGSVGYDALKKAVGGRLKLDARADVDVRLGNWQESFWFRGRGIGANVRL